MTITQTVEVPESRRITLDVPPQIPAGQVILSFTPVAGSAANTEEDCPICAKYRDPETGELRFNDETIAAIKEGDAMINGEIPAKWYNSLDEMLEDLEKDDPDE